MHPTNRELLDGIAEALRTRVAPAVGDDAWAASELRSIDALLGMMAARDEHEVNCLVQDNADLGALLVRLGVALPETPTAVHGTDPRPTLRAANRLLRGLLDDTLHALHRDQRADDIAQVREYLVRSVARDQVLYGPLGGRALF